MIITFDKSTRAVTVSNASFKTTPREALQIKLLDNGRPATLATGETLKLEIKPKNVTDGSVLIDKTLAVGTRDANLAAYVGEVNAFTVAALAALGINDGDATNDAASPLAVDGVVLLYPSGGGDPIESDTFGVSLVAAKHLSTDASPSAVPSPDAAWVAHGHAQSLTDPQKAQALSNIGAATAAQGALAATAVQPAGLSSYATTSALTTGLAGKADLSGGKVPSGQLPSFVDDVIEAANFAALPGTGETGKIYVTLDANKTYRWSGSAYVEISNGLDIASQAEAEAGTDNTKAMTPLRTAEAIAALGSGGGGAALVRHIAGLSGFTDPGSSGAPPSPLIVQFGNVGDYGVINLNIDGVSYLFTFGTSDPADGSHFIDISGFVTLQDYSVALKTAIEAAGVPEVGSGDYTLDAPDSTMTITGIASGSARGLAGTSSLSSSSISGGGNGTDDTAPSGDVSSADIIAGIAGKSIKLVRLGRFGDAAFEQDVAVGYDLGGSFTQMWLITAAETSALVGEPAWSSDVIGLALAGLPAGASLKAIISGASPVGGSISFWAIAEQV